MNGHGIKEAGDLMREISGSKRRRVEDLPDGNRLVHDGARGYVVDSVTGEFMGWRLKTGSVGGFYGWMEARFGRDPNTSLDSARNRLYVPQVTFR